jgi:hypothetical protein
MRVRIPPSYLKTQSMRLPPKDIISKAQLAHEAIHNPSATYADIDGLKYPIIKHRNGCRCVVLGGYIVIEQNKNKESAYARRAKSGEHLSWIMPSDPNVAWQLIENHSK